MKIKKKVFGLIALGSNCFLRELDKKALGSPELRVAVRSAKGCCWGCAVATTEEQRGAAQSVHKVSAFSKSSAVRNPSGAVAALGSGCTGLQSCHINRCSVVAEACKSCLLDLLLTSLRDLYWVADSSLLTARPFPQSFYQRRCCRPACRCCAELTQWQTALPGNYQQKRGAAIPHRWSSAASLLDTG